MPCGTCKYWVAMAEKVNSIAEGVHTKSRLGICRNPIVNDMVFAATYNGEIIILNNSVEFDEQFSCSFEESNTN
jgi:hypothetical protein